MLRDVRVIWRQVPKTVGRGHYSVRLAFAPDSTLFIASSERMRFDPAQDFARNLGKIVRIQGDGSLPRDNSFVADSGARPESWSMGHRNPSGIAFQPGSGGGHSRRRSPSLLCRESTASRFRPRSSCTAGEEPSGARPRRMRTSRHASFASAQRWRGGS